MVEVAGTEEFATTLERSETSTRRVDDQSRKQKGPASGAFLVEVAGVEADAPSTEVLNKHLLKFVAEGGGAQIGAQLNPADEKSLLDLVRLWPKLPTSVKVAIHLIVEAQGGEAGW